MCTRSRIQVPAPGASKLNSTTPWNPLLSVTVLMILPCWWGYCDRDDRFGAVLAHRQGCRSWLPNLRGTGRGRIVGAKGHDRGGGAAHQRRGRSATATG